MRTALFLIDAQRNMLEGGDPVPAAAQLRPSLDALLTRARADGWTVVHVQNDGGPDEPDEPHTEGWELVLRPDDGELVVRKDVPDAFAARADLAEELRRQGVDRLVVAGMQSEGCVQATSRAAAREGFRVFLARGAHGTYDDGVPAAEISQQVEQELSDFGIAVVQVEELVAG